MKITPINLIKYNTQHSSGIKPENKPSAETNSVQQPSGVPFAYVSKMITPTFTSVWFEDNIIKSVTGKEYQGAGLYSDNFIDYDKVGWANLQKEQLDITEATDKEILAFQHALALAETSDIYWVQNYNPTNMSAPLATKHTLCDVKSRKVFVDNRNQINRTPETKFLDSPLFDKSGKLKLNCVVWDTETTGLNYEDKNKPFDHIIQIGAVKVKDGNLDKSSIYNQLLNPGTHISEASSIVHGITDKDVAKSPHIEEILPTFLNEYLNTKNGAIVAYNSKFDMGMLKNTVEEYNRTHSPKIPQKKTHEVLDPFILIQRIHPYVGAKKKLSHQYTFLFCKNLDNAHDAYADVAGTVDVLKYALYYLNNHRVDKEKPLTLRDVLLFQNGQEVDNIDINFDYQGVRSDVSFYPSYEYKPLNVFNYSKGYRLDESIIPEMENFIGKSNVKKLNNIIVPEIFLQNDEGVNNPSANVPKKRVVFYTQSQNFKKILKFANIQGYKGKTNKEIISYITEKSKNFIDKDSVSLYVKNTNPHDIKKGNDMPDYKIARKVMAERKNSEN